MDFIKKNRFGIFATISIVAVLGIAIYAVCLAMTVFPGI